MHEFIKLDYLQGSTMGGKKHFADQVHLGNKNNNNNNRHLMCLIATSNKSDYNPEVKNVSFIAVETYILHVKYLLKVCKFRTAIPNCSTYRFRH
jgi:hypothetical protein